MIKDKSAEKRKEEASEHLTSKKLKHEVFTEPTFDATFKILFDTENHKNMLINLLNSLLGFTSCKEIADVKINSKLEVLNFSDKKNKSGVANSIDIICTNYVQQKVFIELQEQKQEYFQVPQLEYLSKLIADQVKKDEKELYNEKVADKYVIVVGKQNIFIAQTINEGQKLFDIDAELKITSFDDKKYCKLFEVPIINSNAYHTKKSIMKCEWLNFLIQCNNQDTEPDINNLIQMGHKIIGVKKWDKDEKTLYWKHKRNIEDALRQQEYEMEKAYKKGYKIGLKIGELNAEIHKIQSMFKLGIPQEKFIPKLEFLTQETIKDKLDDNLNYIKEHLDCSADQICSDLNLLGDLGMLD